MTDCGVNGERRSILGNGWRFIKFWAAAVVLLPVLRFVRYDVPPRPVIIRVNKTLKKGGFIMEPQFIIFDRESGPVAISRKCTHLGCRLNFNELEKLLICPCHQSKFDKTGRRIAGPAKKDLPVYEVETIGDDSNRSYLVSVV